MTTTNELVLGLAAAGCGGTGQAEGGTSGGGDQKRPVTGLRMMVPNTPCSGYDLTARSAAKAMEDAKLARNIEVFNLPGAGGTVGLARVVNEMGNGKLLMQMGLGVVGASYTNRSKATLQDTTPVARLIQEPEAIVVKADSRYRSLQDVVNAWKANPGKLPVGGESSPGGPDHLTPMLFAKAVGLDPRRVSYVAYDGGGELLAAVLGGQVAFAATGAGEFADQIEAGQVRVLAVTGAARVAGLDAPTLKESGVDLEFTNWRGLVAPPGLTDADRESLAGLVAKMNDSQQWKDALAKNKFVDAYLAGAEFTAFFKTENERVGQVLHELGLA